MKIFDHLSKELNKNPASWGKETIKRVMKVLHYHAKRESLQNPNEEFSLYEVLEWALIWHTGEKERLHPTRDRHAEYGKVIEQTWMRKSKGFPKNIHPDWLHKPLIWLVESILEKTLGDDKNGYPILLTELHYINGDLRRH